MPYEVSKLSEELSFGSIVTGLMPKDIGKPEIVEELNKLWIDRGLIVFRDADPSPEFQVALSRCFGTLEPHPIPEYWMDGRPDLVAVTSKPEAGNIVALGGEKFAGWIPWHADTMYIPNRNHGGILRVTKATSWGGETRFLDQISAYDTLPDDLKQLVQDMEIVYQMEGVEESLFVRKLLDAKLVRSSANAASMLARVDKDYPPVVHPAVFEQPETGRRVLNVSPHFAKFVLGYSAAESDELLVRLMQHIESQPFYQHRWSDKNEMILWDNWRMLHSVTGCPVDEVRSMRRTTISGQYPYGRFLEAQAA
ncbi:TauD/TfdA dioxygenase family protein [Rhizorhapis sp. SPR117]|uniref:TauD/TfdA dioxygenase family protein n=1 Tax=Rhizorhapis sp. SPR117 TaxID=2912611 RepID=UPI001F1703B0|nr:TauD/TfdA family dioxygenase [Rhizorhapis sp. SPR117]